MSPNIAAGVQRSGRFVYELPPELEAGAPPEARGLTRDAVRMMVASRSARTILHSTFTLLPTFLDPGDVVVINTSGTIPAAMEARASDGTELVLHLSTRLSSHRGGERWVVEPRRPVGDASERWQGTLPSRSFTLAGGASAVLAEPYGAPGRLWVADLAFGMRALTWLALHGRPIRYGYAERAWPLGMYQNVYVTDPGSAEMPSAGRPFTPDVITRLVAKGVAVAPVVLHTGVASLEADELPCPERVHVPPATAGQVNAAHMARRRVVAVGTTVVRALETAADPDGLVLPYDGWTDVVVTPERGVAVVDGLLTGWHEPASSHLLMLEAVMGPRFLRDCYAAALAEGYRWHEFGDVHLVLP